MVAQRALLLTLCGIAFGGSSWAQVPQAKDQPPSARVELWRGLQAGMTAEEAAAIVRAFPGVTSVKVGSRKGRQTMFANTKGFKVAERPVLIQTIFDGNGLASIELEVLDETKTYMCPSKISETLSLFSQLLGSRYQRAGGIGGGATFTGAGVTIRLTSDLRDPMGSMDLASAFCRAEGGQYGNVFITYLPTSRAETEKGQVLDRVRQAIDEL